MGCFLLTASGAQVMLESQLFVEAHAFAATARVSAAEGP
jgi:hypothetical protein